MTITRRVDCQGLVTTEIYGSVGMTDILNSVVGEAIYTNELWEIIILGAEMRVLRRNHRALETAHYAKETIQFKSRGAIAIVALTDTGRSTANRVAELLRGDVVPVTVFVDESQARKWLSIHMERGRLDATTARFPRPQPRSDQTMSRFH